MSVKLNKICVVGAGAIGGLMAVRLAGTAGAELSVLIRGANLDAVRARGMRLINEDGSEQIARPRASDRIDELGAQDLVILALKAHQLAPVAPQLPALIGSDTLVLTTQNGLPWWYFHKLAGPYQGRRIEAVDPGGVISAALPLDRTLGCIVYPAAELVEPGVIKLIEGDRLPIGELDGADTERARALAERMRAAGFRTPILSDIRNEIWLKLLGNSSFNPISALTHATLEQICLHPPTRELVAAMMLEARTIGEKLGARFKITIDKRIAGAQAVGAHKTSMLQDVESGRALELAALVDSVLELGRITETPTPMLGAVHALTSLLSNNLTAARARLRLEPLR